MCARRLPPRPPRESLSRRDALIALGMLGVTGVLGTCGGISALALLLRRLESASPPPSPPALASIAPSSPMPTTPVATTPPPMVTREVWGAKPPNLNAENEKGLYDEELNPEGWRVYDDLTHLKTVVIHHSVVYSTDDTTTAREVQRLHQQDRGWADVGYHYMVGKTGVTYEGRALNVRGVHTASYNTGTVGVCLLGNYSADTIGNDQWQGLGRILFWLVAALPLTHLAGHRDFNVQTECPGNNLWFSLDQLAQAVGLRRGTDGYDASAHGGACACGCCGV